MKPGMGQSRAQSRPSRWLMYASIALAVGLISFTILCKRYSGELCGPGANANCLIFLKPLIKWHCSHVDMGHDTGTSVTDASLVNDKGAKDTVSDSGVGKPNLTIAGYCRKKDGSKSELVCGEDAFVFQTSPQAPNSGRSFLGVADGVGGWAASGGDSSRISTGFLETMRQLASSTRLSLSEIGKLAFDRMAAQGTYQKGSTTLCTVLLDHTSGMAQISNIGDSAAYVIRNGTLLLKTELGVDGFNTPHQLGFDHQGRPYGSFAKYEKCISFQVLPGDIIMLFSDGIIDNLFDPQIIEFVTLGLQPQMESPSSSEAVAERLQKHAESLVQAAYLQSRDSQLMSPFAHTAKSHGYQFLGGYHYFYFQKLTLRRKQDDITVVLALVHHQPS